MSSPPSIDYFYAAHSVFAYLGSQRLNDMAEEIGAQIVHHPMDLHQVMEEVGSSSFEARSKAHIRYFFGREIELWSKQRKLPWMGRIPTHHHKDYTLANQFLIAAQQQGHNIDQLSHSLLRAHWVDDIDLTDEASLTAVASRVGIDGPSVLHQAQSDATQETYQQNTQAAIQRSVFGSPTYFVGGDMFYGQDRLHFVEQALIAHSVGLG